MIETLRATPGSFEDFVAPEDYDALPPGDLIDLDKAWHAIHFLLTGGPDEAALPSGALFAGEEIGEGFGLGPPRLLSATDVKAFAGLLDSKATDFVQQTLDFKALHRADIYPAIWDREDIEDVEYVAHFFGELRTFMHAAAEKGDAVVLVLM